MAPRPLKKPLPLDGGSGKKADDTGLEPALAPELSRNRELLSAYLGGSDDVVFRPLEVVEPPAKGLAVYADGLVKRDTVEEQILKPLMLELAMVNQRREPVSAAELLSFLERRAVTVGEVRRTSGVMEIVVAVLSGDTAFLVDGVAEALVVNSRGWPSRAVEEPVTESLVRGPREGFTETLRTNTALLRRHLRDPHLRIRQFRLGRRGQTDCALAYLEGVVRPEVVEEVRKRLKTIDIDCLLETGEVEQFIEDSPFSVFPQVQYSERPDKVVAGLLEGRVAVLVDGTPFVVMVPAVFGHFLTSPEDYYERWVIGSLLRFLRYLASLVATFLPALYVALTSFHPGLWPTPLALAIAAGREGIPFPSVVEALLMEIAFEFLREAGARLPRPIGATIGIVGGIIIGDAAVRSRLVSPIMVVVVALTAIASFTIPAYNMAIAFRILRFPITLAAGVLGLYGVILGFIVVNVHLVCLKSFGVVYLSPLVPYRRQDWKDAVFRAPLRVITSRPVMLRPVDRKRQVNRKRGGW
ncbi:MAG: spore germination protein [Moorellales bacterium]